jgi:hypothetical protein
MDNVTQSELLTSLTETLEKLLESRIGIVEASRLIAAASHSLNQSKNPLFSVFVGVDSDTIHFPLGSVRQHWAPDALAHYDLERETEEQHLKPYVPQAAAELLAWVRANAL